MNTLSLALLLILLPLSLCNEDMRPVFCEETCLKVIPRPGPPKSITPAEIKKANDEQARFTKCTRRCSDLYSYTDEKKNDKILDLIKKSNF